MEDTAVQLWCGWPGVVRFTMTSLPPSSSAVVGRQVVSLLAMLWFFGVHQP